MADLCVTAEFVRPGRVGGAEQALDALLVGIGTSMGPADSLRVVGVHRHPGVPQARRVAPAVAARPRFIQESVSFARLSSSCDTYYFPNYFTPPWPSGCRVVTTIHDQQYRHLPDNFSRRKRAWLSAAHRWTLHRADAVTVLSEWVRDDLLRTYGRSIESKLHVVPNAVDFVGFGQGSDRPFERPYVLSVASHYHHKNLRTLVRAFAEIRANHPEVQLVLVGQLGEQLVGVRRADDVGKLIENLGLGRDVVMTGYIDRERLGTLYRHAELFAFPSTFEGFGLPPVEAMGFGLPVITTGCTSLPEVTLGLAEYVDDPLDTGEWSARISEQLRSGSRPSSAVVERVRSSYDPGRIGRQLYDLMVSGT